MISDSRAEPRRPDLNATFDWPLHAEAATQRQTRGRLARLRSELLRQREASLALWMLGGLLWLWIGAAPSALYAARQSPLGVDHLGYDVLSRLILDGPDVLVVCLASLLMALIFGAVLGIATTGEKLWSGRLMAWMMDDRVDALALTSATGLILFLDLGLTHVIMAAAMGYAAPFAQICSGCWTVIYQARWRTQWDDYGLIAILLQSALCLAGAAVIGIGWRVSGWTATTFIWDDMIRAGWPFMVKAPWVSAFPALAAFIIILGLYLLRRGLRQALMRACEAEAAAVRAQPES